MKTHVAWHNVTHNKIRTLAILGGISFSILLMFTQLGFHDACERNSPIIYDMFDFDAILISPLYVVMDDPGSIPMRRLYQARVVEGVKEVLPLYIGVAEWRNTESGKRYDIIVMGIDCTDHPLASEEINDNIGLLKKPDTVMIDKKTTKKYGPHEMGTTVELSGRKVKIVGEYSHGSGFICGASLIMSDLTFSKLFKDFSLRNVSFGLVRFAVDAEPEDVATRIQAALPNDVQLWKRIELDKKEANFHMKIRPVGIWFKAGIIIAFLVGAVILYQILMAEVANNMREYATLKAIGYTTRKLQMIVMEEALLLVSFAYVPAVIFSFPLYAMLRDSARIPIFMTVERLVAVFALSVLMAAVAVSVSIRKVNVGDPADLF